jgi:hypothetical protein
LRKTQIALAVIIALAAPSTAAPANPFARASFAITLPAAAKATKEEGPDFDVYRVKWGQTGSLGIYEGCCPQTFVTDANAVKSDITINGVAVHQTTLRDGESTAKEYYFDFQPEPGTGTEAHAFVVHAWYSNLDEADAKAADDIISTIRRKPARR